MAENEKTAEQSSPAPARGGRSASKDAAPEAEATGVETFQVSDLIERSSGFLQQPPHVVAAAFHGADPDEEVTLDDAKSRVDQWLNDTQSATKE